MDRQRYICLPRECEEQRACRESSRFDHRALPGRSGIQIEIERYFQILIHVLLC